MYSLQRRLLAGEEVSADWITLLRLVIDRVHSRAIGLQFVSVSKFSLALGNLFQLREREGAFIEITASTANPHRFPTYDPFVAKHLSYLFLLSEIEYSVLFLQTEDEILHTEIQRTSSFHLRNANIGMPVVPVSHTNYRLRYLFRNERMLIPLGIRDPFGKECHVDICLLIEAKTFE